ncbi:MAG: bifunctional diaminohydroxyphosphoribosylaminopyrimidine deaminase/5-amino-6-(5-phosphoribosylamino)uracil reductase RibD [Polyangia bacterium]
MNQAPGGQSPRSRQALDDRRWMTRALLLARRGGAATRPNPRVGAVVARGGRLLGEGFHRGAGTPHAEINALEAVQGRQAAGATLYVTLEPCCHIGRTGPCTTAVIAAGITRVVVGGRDPNPLVNGRGIARLRRAGIRVDVGCLEEECAALNRPFFTWIRDRRPLVTMKAAASLDGFIADGHPRPSAAPVWITGSRARAASHRLRGEHHAILVGAGTVISDDPRLTVRLPGAGRPRGRTVGAPALPHPLQPPFLRVILDGKLRIPPGAAVLAPTRGARTLVLGAKGAPSARANALRRAGAEVELLPARQGRIDLARVLAALADRQIQSLLVEGGAQIHAAFIAAGLVDRVALFYAPLLLGGGVPVAAAAPGRATSRLVLGPLRVKRLGPDLLIQADVVRRR